MAEEVGTENGLFQVKGPFGGPGSVINEKQESALVGASL